MRARRAWLLTIGLASAAGQGMTQPGPSADLRVQSIDLQHGDGLVTVRIVVSNDDRHPANQSALTVFLPPPATSARLPVGCRSTPGRSGDRIDCDLGVLRPRDSREVIIVVKVPRSGASQVLAALVRSATPDPIPGNNRVELDLRADR